MNHGGEFKEVKQYNYQLTKYPKIFSCTYWGGFQHHKLDNPEIIENRNAFVEEFRLEDLGVKVSSEIKNNALRRKVLMKYFHDKETFRDFDHKEVYMIDANEYVIIFSPYSARTEKADIQLETLGWTRYKELYTKGTRTYLLHLTYDKISKLKQSWIGCH